MKKIVFTLFIILISQLGMAQESTAAPNEEKIYHMAAIEVQPEFPGGPRAFNMYVAKNYNYSNITPPLKGTLFVEFIIEKDGSIDEIKILKDLGFGTKEEAIRLIENSPKWKPGVQEPNLIQAIEGK